jgi:hypothetical protein
MCLRGGTATLRASCSDPSRRTRFDHPFGRFSPEAPERPLLVIERAPVEADGGRRLLLGGRGFMVVVKWREMA